jgi:hypothetical protein
MERKIIGNITNISLNRKNQPPVRRKERRKEFQTKQLSHKDFGKHDFIITCLSIPEVLMNLKYLYISLYS